MNNEITLSIQSIITIISMVVGPLIGVIVYFYHRIEKNHESDITDYKERIKERESEVLQLKSKITAMESTIERLYTQFNKRRNGG